MKQKKELTYKNAVSPVAVEVVYHSAFYTVARASVQVQNGNKYEAHAEGIAVRCWKDANDDPEQGKNVASGRACKALHLKLEGKMHREHIKRATDLLMNG